MIRSRYGGEVYHATNKDQMVRKYEGMAHQAKREGDMTEAQYLFNHAEHYKKGENNAKQESRNSNGAPRQRPGGKATS